MNNELYRRKYLKYKAKYKFKVQKFKYNYNLMYGGAENESKLHSHSYSSSRSNTRELTIFDFEQYKFPFNYEKILITNGIMENELYDANDFILSQSDELIVCVDAYIKVFDLSGQFIRKVHIGFPQYISTHILQLDNSNIVIVLRQKDDVENDWEKCLILLFDNTLELIKKTSSSNWIRGIFQFKNSDGYIGVMCANGTLEIYTSQCVWINTQRVSRTKPNPHIFSLSSSHCMFVHGLCSRYGVHLLSNKILNINDIDKPNYKIDVEQSPLDIIKLGEQHFLLLTAHSMGIYNITNGKLLYTVPNPPFEINYKRCVYTHENLYVLSDNKILVFSKNDNFDSNVGTISNVLKSIKMYNEITEPIELDYFVGVSNEKIFNYNGERVSKGWDLIKNSFRGLDINVETNINVFDQLYANKNRLLGYKPLFIFKNIDIGNRDTSLDAGGLSKHTFVELSKYLTNPTLCKYFTKDQTTNIYDLNADYFNMVKITPPTQKFEDLKGKIFFLGQLFAYAIIQRVTINIDLNPFLLYQMTHDLDIEKLTVDDVKYLISDYGTNLLSKYPYACLDLNRGKRTLSCTHDKNEKSVSDIRDIPIVNLEKIKEDIIHKCSITKIFVEGFRSQLNVVDTNVRYLNPYMLNIAISGINVVDYSGVMKHLHFINFEQEDVQIMENLIKSYADNSTNDLKGNLYMRTFLMAITGSDTIPIAGYGVNELRIELNEYARVPYEIHTCFNQMKINKEIFELYKTATDKTNTVLHDVMSEITLTNVSQLFNII